MQIIISCRMDTLDHDWNTFICDCMHEVGLIRQSLLFGDLIDL